MILCVNGKIAGENPAEVLTYKIEGDFAGKWTPSPKSLVGVNCVATPCVLPYTKRGVGKPIDDSIWLLTVYSEFSTSEICTKDFDLSELSGP